MNWKIVTDSSKCDNRWALTPDGHACYIDDSFPICCEANCPIKLKATIKQDIKQENAVMKEDRIDSKRNEYLDKFNDAVNDFVDCVSAPDFTCTTAAYSAYKNVVDVWVSRIIEFNRIIRDYFVDKE